jgi:hypothetical protein
MAATPMPVPVNLLGLELRRLLAARHCGTTLRVGVRRPRGIADRPRREWRGLCRSGQGGGSRRNTNCKFQEVAALHDVFLAGLKL